MLLWRLLVFGLSSAPGVVLIVLALRSQLGPDPGKVLVDGFGQAALVLLLLSLSMTPMNLLMRWVGWVRVRRQLGLWCFCYACLHAVAFVVFLLGLEVARLATEVAERPYILLGVLGWLILAALAATSGRRAVRLLGRRWKPLHRLAYLAAVLALLHMLWVVRSDAALWALFLLWALSLALARLYKPLGKTAGYSPKKAE